MGYSTDFNGGLKFNRELTHKEWTELIDLASYDTDLYEQYTDEPLKFGSYIQWTPNKDGTQLEWNGGEKFYNYIYWLRWLIKHYMKPRGLVLNGEIRFQGEEMEDSGVIIATNNVITQKKLKVEGIVECPNCSHRFVPANV